ncbi:carboxylesterase/lipase family protein [Chiayiivirga flava]|uniref:Carboxylic ester hydrolase n=1 Tax=Chiayiivirga flava TaxID=659595 RepID=A0A7W8FYB4_9GAMM|nr:carboxylesterase/lipase family protein [Chiayiivirga flava]MBB5207217.1 para-nitrobenzyl esterase [Chiayiivirga flava]
MGLSRRTWIAGTAAGALLLGTARRAAADRTVSTPIATVTGGRVRGIRDGDLFVFRGIRYGADTAATRFAPPGPPRPWEGVRDATAFGNSAPQRGADAPGSEDCLFLNVTTPALRDGARRPVLVYLHGGGYSTGAGSDPLYDGSALCRRGDVVVVTLNHRLNVFGYLALDGFGDGRFAGSGNVGQLDLIAALRWVRRHADEFGGDAGNVTVFGQSGGGAKIATLMAMPAAAGLFHRAMTMSGQQVTAAGPRAARQRAAMLLDALKIAPAQVDRLREVPMERVLEASAIRDPSRIEDTGLYFGPVLDGVSLHRHPFYPDAPAQSRGIPMLIGNTRDETRAFLGSDPENFSLTWDTLPAKLVAQQYVDLPADMVIAEYRRLYPRYTPSDVFFAATTAGRSWRGAIEEAEARARQGAPAWVYQLDWPSPADDGRLRAFHTLDIPLVFGTLDAPGSRTGTGADARAVARRMGDALLAFARTGDPNHAGLPAWASYSLQRRETMVFDARSRAVDDPRRGERLLYARAPFVQRGTF